MQYSIVALAALVGSAVAGWPANGTVVYTTDVYTAYTTVCPAATTLSFNGVTYTVSESTTLTITNCPCTVVKPVTTASVVSTPAPAPPASNGTVVATSTPTIVPANGGERAFAASGGALAGLLALAAYAL